MLIDPVYPSADQDERLVSVTEQMLRMQVEIQDAEWEGRDATALRQQFKMLNAKFMEGVIYEPRF